MLYKIDVSLLTVKSKPSGVSKNVGLIRDTIVKSIGPGTIYKNERWLLIQTLSTPVVKGYVQAKYLTKISF